jgi:hypothetical protein
LTDEGGRKVYRAVAVPSSGVPVRLTAGGREDTGIAWNPRTGKPTVGAVPDAPGQPVPVAAGATVDVPPSGFDVPVAWSPDGKQLAVRHFTGDSTDQPGMESVQLTGQDGSRTDVMGSAPLILVGWASQG